MTPDLYAQALTKIDAQIAYIEHKKSAAYQRLGSLGLEGWDRFTVPWLTLKAVLELPKVTAFYFGQAYAEPPYESGYNQAVANFRDLIIEAVLGLTTTEEDAK